MGNVRDEIAKNLLFYRKKAGLTQKEFANSLGVNNSAVSNWEKGLNSIDIDTLHKACITLNVSINEMFGTYSNFGIKKSPTSICEAGDSIKDEIVEIYEELNDEGQNQMLEHAHYLESQGKYKKRDTDSRLA